MKYLLIALIFLTATSIASAQKKMDLDDLEIKGELHNDDRLRLLAREKNALKNFVKFRTSYRQEIMEGLRKPKPHQEYFELGEYTP